MVVLLACVARLENKFNALRLDFELRILVLSFFY